MPLIVALLVLLAAAPAHAQDGATVARHGEVQLLVRDDVGGGSRAICISLRRGDTEDENESRGRCAEPPTGRMSAEMVGATFGSSTFVGGAVPAGTVEVELEFARGARVRARAVGGEAYTGRHAGRLGYFLAETTGVQRPRSGDDEDEPVLIRRFDAEGNLIGAAGGDGSGGTTVGGPQTLLRSRGMRVSAAASRVFAPSVRRIDRTEISVCLRFASRDGSRGSGQCIGPGPALPLLSVLPRRECGHGLLVEGFAAPLAATVEIVLGDGRRKRARTLDVTALGTPARAVAIVVPPGVAVRSARALDAAGNTIETQPVRSAPAARRCPPGVGGLVAFGAGSLSPAGSADPGQLVAGAAPEPRLVARDEGDALCVGIDGFGGDHHGCHVPPPEADIPQTITRRTPAYSAAGGIVPPGAHGVRVVFEGGRKVTAAISDGGAYGGMYRGHVRFFLASTGPGRDVVAVETFGAAGRLLASLPWHEGFQGRPRTVARGPGYRVFGSRYDLRFKFPGRSAHRIRGTCHGLAFGRRAPDPADCARLRDAYFVGEVACSSRRGVLIGWMANGLRGARFELAGGGAIDSRVVRIPGSLGGGRLWILEIPPDARVARLRLLGKLPGGRFGSTRQRVRPFALPAPRRQCGYGLDVTF